MQSDNGTLGNHSNLKCIFLPYSPLVAQGFVQYLRYGVTSAVLNEHSSPDHWGPEALYWCTSHRYHLGIGVGQGFVQHIHCRVTSVVLNEHSSPDHWDLSTLYWCTSSPYHLGIEVGQGFVQHPPYRVTSPVLNEHSPPDHWDLSALYWCASTWYHLGRMGLGFVQYLHWEAASVVLWGCSCPCSKSKQEQ